METKTRSQLFPDKEYETLIDELEEGDYDLKSELYKVTIFNKVIHISPGNVIKDERIATLYYCYVYVIINKRVKAKLGVYEKIIEGRDIPDQFDLSEFDEGSMLVFDDYYKEPKRINEFEIIEQVEAGEDNVFLYLQSKINQDPNAEDIKKHSGSRYTKIYDMIRKNKGKEKEYFKIFDKYSKYFKDLVKFNEEFMEKLESSDLNPFNLMFILSILELYFSVKFVFVDENQMLVDDSEIRNVFNTTIYKEVIVINIKTENIIEKTDDISQLKIFKEKYKMKVGSVLPKPEESESEEEKVVVEEREISDEEEERTAPAISKSKAKDKTLLAESKTSEFDTSVETGTIEPPEKPSKISFKGSELKPKSKTKALSVSEESTEPTPLKTSSFLTGTSHKVKGKKLSGITEESVEESPSAKPTKKPSKPTVEVEEPVKEKKKSSSKTVEVEEPVKEKKKSSSKSTVEVEEPPAKPKKSSKSTVETKTLTTDEEAYKKQVEQMASLYKQSTKVKSGKSKASKDE